MEKFKAILVQIFCTKIGWLIICLLGTGVFTILSDKYDWCWIAMYISLIYPAVLTLIMIVYAWIINPIREAQKNKKLKDGK